MEQKPLRLTILAVLTFVGFVISVYQSYHYYLLQAGAAGFQSFCSFGPFDCEAVEASPYARFLFGIPLSGFAAGWYLALLIVAWIGRDLYWRREALRACLIFTGVGTLFSFIYLYIMVAVIQSLCSLCILIDIINVVSLGLVLSMKPEKGGEFDRAKWKTFGWVTGGSIAVLLVANLIMAPRTPSTELMNDVIASIINDKPISVDVSGSTIGSSSAPVTIVKFSDFQCPACRHGAQSLHPILRRYKNKVRLVFKNFPLDPKCNRVIERSVHPFACQAAKIAFCAGKNGRFIEVYEEIFENQKNIDSKFLDGLISKHGLNADAMKACIADPTTDETMRKDIDEGIRIGVRSTPTFFINGRKVEGSLPAPMWGKVIEGLIGKK